MNYFELLTTNSDKAEMITINFYSNLMLEGTHEAIQEVISTIESTKDTIVRLVTHGMHISI